MAIYEFVCECGYKDEHMMLMKDRNNKQKCIKCKKVMQRLIGNPGFSFKGTGFYTTDVLHKKTHRKQAIKEKNKRMEG